MTSYNLTQKGENVRIGNWFEEIRLKQDTGIRFYPDIKDKKGSLMTQSRCITHTEQTLPKDYSSNTKDTIIDPKTHADYKNNKSTLGPRARRMEEQIKNDIEEEYKAREKSDFIETRRTNYSTASKDSFGISSFTPTLKENDPSMRIPTRASNYSTDAAITYYSHTVCQPNNKISFPASFVGSTNPFKKSAAFSSDIVRETVARRTETNERPKPLPTLLEFRCINEFRQRLITAAQVCVGSVVQGHTDGRAIRHLIDTMWNNQTGYEVIHINTFEDCLASTYDNLSLSAAERSAIVCAFDTRSDGNLSLSELTNLVRKTPSPRRLELIDMFYSLLDPAGTGVAEYNTIVRRAASGSSGQQHLKIFLATLNCGRHRDGVESISVDEFFDYYIDVSAEMVQSDELFESILVDTWRTD